MSLFRISFFICICQAEVKWKGSPLLGHPVYQRKRDILEPGSQILLWWTQPLRFPCPRVGCLLFFLVREGAVFAEILKTSHVLNMVTPRNIYLYWFKQILNIFMTHTGINSEIMEVAGSLRNSTLGKNKTILWFVCCEQAVFADFMKAMSSQRDLDKLGVMANVKHFPISNLPNVMKLIIVTL